MTQPPKSGNICRRCCGTGTICPEPVMDTRPCPQCDGTGHATDERNHAGPWLGGRGFGTSVAEEKPTVTNRPVRDS